jgi:hypothetical protein
MPIEKALIHSSLSLLHVMRSSDDEIMILKSKEQGLVKFKYSFSTTNFSSFATNGKNRSISERAERFFERFFRMQKNFFSNKNTMKVMKVQQKATENPREKSF